MLFITFQIVSLSIKSTSKTYNSISFLLIKVSKSFQNNLEKIQ